MKRAAIVPIILAIVFALSGCNKAPEPVAQAPAPVPVVEPTPTETASTESPKLPGEEKNLPVIDLNSSVETIHLSPDHSLLALLTQYQNPVDSELLLFSMKDHRLIGRTSASTQHPEWSLDSKRVVATDGQSLVVMERSGRVSRFKADTQSFQFRAKDSFAIMYTWQPGSDSKYQYRISELDIRTGKRRDFASAPSEYAGLTHFRGQDCYAEYGFNKSRYHAWKLRVRSVDTRRILLEIPLGGIDSDGIWVDFSPDSKWIALQWAVSQSNMLNIGNVKDAKRLMTDEYVGAYNGSTTNGGYWVDWFDSSEPPTQALICDYSGTTAIGLHSGYVYLHEYEGRCMAGLKPDGYGSGVVVVDDKGIRIDKFAPPGHGPETMAEVYAKDPGVDRDPDIGMIAKFRIKPAPKPEGE